MAISSATLSTSKLFNNGGNPQTTHHQYHRLQGKSLYFTTWVNSLHTYPTISLNHTPPNFTHNTRKKRKTSFYCSNEKTTQTQITKKKKDQYPVFSEGRDEDMNRLVCPGCGVYMQDMNPNFPGFYRERVLERGHEWVLGGFVDELDEDEEEFDDELMSKSTMDKSPNISGQKRVFKSQNEEVLGGSVNEVNEFDGVDEEFDGLKSKSVKFEDDDEDFKDEFINKFEEFEEGEEGVLGVNDGIDWDSDWEIEDDEEKWEKELDGFTPAGVGYGNITEETLKKERKIRISKAERKQMAREARKDEEAVTVCARCHSLRNYGQVKNQNAENLIPDFDFDRLIATRLMKPTGYSNASVVVMVVDCADFDGSFPKRAAKSLFKVLEGKKKDAKFSKLPKLVLVATKVDLLPSQVSPTRLDRWVRNRAKSTGAPKLSGVFLVSAHKDLGVRNLLSFIKELAGPRGNVWVIGAQNAGKSTLINAFAKREGVKITKLTEAALPGTTLGILRIGGILPAKAKMYDTPGLLHPYLMTMRLTRDEQKMAEIRKELQPRTYRMKAGQAVHVGGLMRLDLIQASVETIYVSIFASANVSLHLGKVENADEIWKKHAGIRLQPPVGEDRVSELGEWKPKEIKVSGISWEVNSIDIAVAGLGWFSVGLKGEATLILWMYDGIEITLREPLVLDRATFLERSGFLLPKAISDAIGNQSRLEAEKKQLRDEMTDDSLSEARL